jgi:hypothetical protein
MINLAIGKILLPLRTLLLIGSLIQLLGGTVLSHMAFQSALETSTKTLTSLRGGFLLVWGYWTRNLLYILPRLLYNWRSYLLLGIEHQKTGMLHLKVGMLHQELGTLVLELPTWDLHRCMTWKWGSGILARLRKVGPSVASRMLAQKNHLAFAILFHLFQLILDDDGLVNQTLEIWVVCVEQLKLDLIIVTLEKHILLLLVGVDVINDVP